MSDITKSAREFLESDITTDYPKAAEAYIGGLCELVESLQQENERLREKLKNSHLVRTPI